MLRFSAFPLFGFSNNYSLTVFISWLMSFIILIISHSNVIFVISYLMSYIT